MSTESDHEIRLPYGKKGPEYFSFKYFWCWIIGPFLLTFFNPIIACAIFFFGGITCTILYFINSHRWYKEFDRLNPDMKVSLNLDERMDAIYNKDKK